MCSSSECCGCSFPEPPPARSSASPSRRTPPPKWRRACSLSSANGRRRASEALSGDLAKLLGRAPGSAELAAAPCLFASVIDAPGGLSIMTIHGFCERVLRRYSFEANVPPGFTVLTEEEARDALSEAQAQAFASAKSGPLRDALNSVVAFAGEAEFRARAWGDAGAAERDRPSHAGFG